MPRRKPRNLDAVRFEMGTFERNLAKDAIMVQGMKAAAIPAAATLVGLGLAAAGFFMYNKIEDLSEWVEEGWKDGFGLVNDPTQTQDQVSNFVSPNRNPPHLEGMSAFSIYELHYDMRDDLKTYFSRMYCQANELEWTGANDSHFTTYVWSTSWLGTGSPETSRASSTFRFERDNVIEIAGEDVNEISEYVYQMIIRETDSRNTQARLASGVLGAASTGIGAAFSEATHWALRSSGFMRGEDGWDGQNWEDANGANRDPLLNFAWARTDFQTGKWWSTIDSQGDLAFWMDVSTGLQGGSKGINAQFENPENYSRGVWSYEQIIWFAHQEMQQGHWGPFIMFLAEHGQMPLVTEPTAPAIPTGEAPSSAEEEQSIADQEEASNESGRDDYMPGEEPPEERPDEPPRD